MRLPFSRHKTWISTIQQLENPHRIRVFCSWLQPRVAAYVSVYPPASSCCAGCPPQSDDTSDYKVIIKSPRAESLCSLQMPVLRFGKIRTSEPVSIGFHSTSACLACWCTMDHQVVLSSSNFAGCSGFAVMLAFNLLNLSPFVRVIPSAVLVLEQPKTGTGY